MYLYDASISGKTAGTKGTSVRVRSSPSTTASILVTHATSGTTAGKLTGYYSKDGNYMWYQLSTTAGKTGWLRNDLLTTSGTATQVTNPLLPTSIIPATTQSTTGNDTQAQKLLNEIVAQDKETMNHLNQASAMIDNLQGKGVNTAASANKLTAIINRLQERQAAMQKTTWAKVTDKITSAWGSVKKFFGMNGLGVVPVVIVGAIALAAGAGTTALITLKPWKNQSTIDLKESKELKSLLDAADPQVAVRIREDLKTQVVDAYTTGERQGSFSGMFKIGTYIGVGILGILAMNYFMKKN